MGQEARLSCRCGKVRGRVSDARPESTNHIVCYCDDCQAYAHWLARADLLNANGGSDIVQVAPSALVFEHGQELIRGVRLSPKGLYRWYASCCNTPVGNTLRPAIPFVGIVTSAFESAPEPVDDVFGPPAGAVLCKFAVGEPPAEGKAIMFKALRRILGWRIRGKAWPHPFFERGSSSPRYPVTTLTESERNALRSLCGPKPVAV